MLSKYSLFSQAHEIPIKHDEYDQNINSGNYMGNNCDIFKRINAMLDNTLDINNLAALNNDQAKRKYFQISNFLFVLGTTLYIFMSALPYRQVFSLFL